MKLSETRCFKADHSFANDSDEEISIMERIGTELERKN